MMRKMQALLSVVAVVVLTVELRVAPTQNHYRKHQDPRNSDGTIGLAHKARLRPKTRQQQRTVRELMLTAGWADSEAEEVERCWQHLTQQLHQHHHYCDRE